MCKDQPVIEEIKILSLTVREIRLQYHEAPSGTQNPMDFAQAFSYLFAAVEVFIDVAGEDSVNRRLSQESQVRSGGRNTAHVGVGKTFQTLFIDVDGYFRSRLDVIDEVTKAGAQVKSHPVGPDVALQIPA